MARLLLLSAGTSHPLFEEGDGASGGGGSTTTVADPPVEKPDHKAIDKITDTSAGGKKSGDVKDSGPVDISGGSVVVGDKTYTAQEIKDLQAKADRTDGLAEQVEHIHSLYDKDLPRDKAIERTRRLMADSKHFSAADIDATIAETYPEEEGKGGKKGEAKDEPQGQKMSDEHIDLFNMHIQQHVDDAIDSGPFRIMIEGIARRDHDGKIENVPKETVAHFKSLVDKGIRDKLGRTYKETGKLRLTMIRDFAPDVINDEFGKARRLLGDPKTMGRVPEADGGEGRDSLKDFLNSDPVPEPKMDKDKSLAEFDEDYDDFTVDRLTRIATEAIFKQAEGSVA